MSCSRGGGSWQFRCGSIYQDLRLPYFFTPKYTWQLKVQPRNRRAKWPKYPTSLATQNPPAQLPNIAYGSTIAKSIPPSYKVAQSTILTGAHNVTHWENQKKDGIEIKA